MKVKGGEVGARAKIEVAFLKGEDRREKGRGKGDERVKILSLRLMEGGSERRRGGGDVENRKVEARLRGEKEGALSSLQTTSSPKPASPLQTTLTTHPRPPLIPSPSHRLNLFSFQDVRPLQSQGKLFSLTSLPSSSLFSSPLESILS